jgi:hypothetical protein
MIANRSVIISTPYRCTRRSALTVRLGLVLANVDDDVTGFLRFVGEVVLDNTPRSTSVTFLSIERCTRVVGNHAIATTEGVLDRSPDVVAGCRLDVPDVTRVA